MIYIKIGRNRFNYLTKTYPNHKLYKIGKDKYLETVKPKKIIKNILELFKSIFSVPVCIIYYLLETIVEIIQSIPEYLKILWGDFKNCLPIRYIKVVDDEIIQEIKFKRQINE